MVGGDRQICKCMILIYIRIYLKNSFYSRSLHQNPFISAKGPLGDDERVYLKSMRQKIEIFYKLSFDGNSFILSTGKQMRLPLANYEREKPVLIEM